MRRVPDQCLLLPFTDESKAVQLTPAAQRLTTSAITFPVAAGVAAGVVAVAGSVAGVAVAGVAAGVVAVASLGPSWS